MCVRVCVGIRVCMFVQVCVRKSKGEHAFMCVLRGAEGGVGLGIFAPLYSCAFLCMWLYVCLC